MSDKLGYCSEEAAAIAMRLGGFGPNIYLRNSSEWEELVGADNGRGVYAFIMGLSDEPEAVPPTIFITQDCTPT
jgi:hypothetical protein